MKRKKWPIVRNGKSKSRKRVLIAVFLVGVGLLGWSAYHRLAVPLGSEPGGRGRTVSDSGVSEVEIAVSDPTLVLLFPLSGLFAEEGRMMAMGARLAWEERQASGLAGKLRIVDAAGKVDRVEMITADQVADPHVVAAIAHLPERILNRIMPLFNKKGPALLIPALSHENLYRHQWVFPLLTSDRREGRSASEIADRLTGGGKVAVLASADQYGELLATEFDNGCRKRGLACLSVVADHGSSLIRSVGRILREDPELVWIAGLPLWGAKAVDVLIRRGFNGKILVPRSYGWLHPLDLFGKDAERLLILRSAVLGESVKGPAADFSRRFERSFRRHPDILAALTYDAVGWVGRCLKPLPVNRDLFRRRFVRFRSPQQAYQGITGAFFFGEDGTVHHPLVVTIYRNGEFVAYPQGWLNGCSNGLLKDRD